MKKYLQYIKENQQYLTEPYDPEFEVKIDIKPQFDMLMTKFKMLADKLGIDFSYYKWGGQPIPDIRFQSGMRVVDFKFKLENGVLSIQDINTLEDMEKRLRASLYVKENQQYLTEPYDPDFDVEISIESQIEHICNKMHQLGKMLGLKVTTEKPNSLREYIRIIYFEGKSGRSVIGIELYPFRLRVDGISDKLYIEDRSGKKDYHTLRDIENKLRETMPSLKENQQYLTEPYDPDTTTFFEMKFREILDPIEYQLQLMAKKLGLEYEEEEHSDNECYYVFSNNEHRYRIKMKFGFVNLRFLSDNYKFEFKTVGEIEEYLKKCFKL